MRKIQLVILLALALLLGGCRTRVVTPELDSVPVETEQEAPTRETAAPVRLDAVAEPELADASEETTDPDAAAERDETSERREFSDSASGELTPDAETPLYAPTEQPVAVTVAAGENTGAPVNVEAETAELTATETVAAQEAEQLGVGEDGEVAESMQTYYLTLLADRVGPLFECKRMYVYWETESDHTTVHKSSTEHRLILDAGAYDVSAKLLEDALTVDDGWISRKNPDAVVKVAEGGALDTGAARALCDELAARPDWSGIGAVRNRQIIVLSKQLLNSQAGRTAAMVYLAKLLYPAQMEDVDANEALRALTREATGSAYNGVYAYTM